MDFKKRNHDGSVAKSAVFLQNWATLTLLFFKVIFVMKCKFYQANPAK